MYILTRLFFNKDSIIGIIEKDKKLFSWTIENKEKCIPTGKYDIKWTPSSRFPPTKIEICNVKGRNGIRIHSASYGQNLLGCVSLAYNRQGIWVNLSRNAVKDFEDQFPKKTEDKIIVQDILSIHGKGDENE
jgi:hypothetical protein